MSEPNAQGGCYCGAVEYRITCEVKSTGMCYCADCRRISAAPGVAWFTVRRSQFEITRGEPEELVSSPQVIRLFCGRCGTHLTYTHANRKEEIDVTTCSLADPEPFTFNTSSTGTADKISWAP
jgi:hypothetical protein